MGETNSPSLAHVGYDISPLKRVYGPILAKFEVLDMKDVVCILKSIISVI
jgi:hypothetical protein